METSEDRGKAREREVGEAKQLDDNHLETAETL
jgi:hypothetical protein